MTYHAAWLLAEDQDFFVRVGMCYEEQGSDYEAGLAARFAIASAPGFAAAYQYALDTGVESPGKAQEVISDAQLLSAVQAELAP